MLTFEKKICLELNKFEMKYCYLLFLSLLFILQLSAQSKKDFEIHLQKTLQLIGNGNIESWQKEVDPYAAYTHNTNDGMIRLEQNAPTFLIKARDQKNEIDVKIDIAANWIRTLEILKVEKLSRETLKHLEILSIEYQPVFETGRFENYNRYKGTLLAIDRLRGNRYLIGFENVSSINNSLSNCFISSIQPFEGDEIPLITKTEKTMETMEEMIPINSDQKSLQFNGALGKNPITLSLISNNNQYTEVTFTYKEEQYFNILQPLSERLSIMQIPSLDFAIVIKQEDELWYINALNENGYLYPDFLLLQATPK